MNNVFWRTIGRRRTRNFAVIAAINVAMVAALALWQLPLAQQAQTTLQQTEQKKMDLQNQIVQLPAKFEQMQKNEQAYEAMRLRGFFAEQDRIAIRQIMNDLRVMTGVRQVAYDIKPQVVVQNQALSATDKELLQSDVTVKLSGLTDLEMREFVHTMQDTVPGFSAITRQNFKRGDELNDINLIKAGNGGIVNFVESTYSFGWFTLRDKPDPLGMQSPDGTMPGVAPGGVPIDPLQAQPVPVVPSAGVVPPVSPAAPGVTP